MKYSKNAWLSGAIALAATLFILFGGQAIYQNFAVAKPLDKAFADIEGVKAVAWEKAKDDKAITLRVSLAGTPNLQLTYTTIEDKARAILGKGELNIVISDSRTEELEQAYHEMHLYIQEAVATGRFSQMADQVKEKAAKAGVDSRVYVDSQNIYLQLAKDSAELYTVIPRTNEPGVK